MAPRNHPLSRGSLRAAPWRIELLGGLQARRGRTLITKFRTRRAAALLARLALHPHCHQRVDLIDMLWPGADPSAGRQNLSQALSELRRQLGARAIRASRDTVCLVPETFTCDVGDFERALAEAHATSGPARIHALERAAELSTAPLLPGVDYEWAVASRERIQAETAAALRELALQAERDGDLPRAFDLAFRCVRIDPLDEEAHRELVRLYEHAGRPAAALAHLRELEHDLQRRLGASPDDETKALAAALHERLQGLSAEAVS